MNVMFNIAKYDAGVYKHKATEEAIGQSSLSLVQRIPWFGDSFKRGSTVYSVYKHMLIVTRPLMSHADVYDHRRI